MGIGEFIGSMISPAGGSGGSSAFDFFPNPIKWAQDQFNAGQARDEARSIRAGDIERDEKWRERDSVTGRIKEGLANGLSLTAAAGMQPGGGMTATVGQDTSYLQNLNNSQNIDTLAPLQRKLLEQQIKSQELDNLKKAQELEPPMVPGKPEVGDSFLPGGSQSIKGGRRIDNRKMDRTMSHPEAGWSEPGAINSVGWEQTPTGIAPIPSKDLKERIEDSPYEFRHFMNTSVMPSLESMTKVLPPPPKGSVWIWNPVMMEYQLGKSRLREAYDSVRGGFMKYRLRKVKNTNPFYGGYTTEGYFDKY